MWIGHANGKVSLFKDNIFSGFVENDRLANSSISSFVENDGIWIGTYGDGVFRYTFSKKLTHFNVDNGMSDNAVYTLCKDKNNNIWAATDGGLTHFIN
jgi:ligand-binding sensor domain-containing protein